MIEGWWPCAGMSSWVKVVLVTRYRACTLKRLIVSDLSKPPIYIISTWYHHVRAPSGIDWRDTIMVTGLYHHDFGRVG